MRRWLRRSCLTPLAILVWMLLMAPAQAAAPLTSPATGLARAQAALQAGRPSLAAGYLRSLRVEVPAAQVAVSSLDSGHLGRALSQVESLRAALGLAPHLGSQASLRTALGAVYRSPQLAALHRRQSAASASLLSDLGGLLLHLLAGLFHLVGRLVWLVLALAVLTVGALSAALLLHRARGRLPEALEAAVEASSREMEVRPERLFAAADQMQSRGNFKEAVRLAFQALLMTASSSRVLAVDPAWTNSDLLRAARQVGDLEPRLRPLVGQFNAVVYGGRDPGPGGCAEFTQSCRATALGLPR